MKRFQVKGQKIQAVETDHGTLSAPIIVNCLGSWSALDDAFPGYLPVKPARGQMLAFIGPSRMFRRIIISDRTYIVQRRDKRVLVGSTIEDVGFEKMVTGDGIHSILTSLRQLSSGLGQCRYLQSWAGFRPATPDGLPILGATEIEGLFIATGHYRHGILLAPITAQLLAELILQKHSSFDLNPFSLKRF